MSKGANAFVWLLATFLPLYASGAELLLQGRVIGISDGDTITILDSNNAQHRIRLSGIDAPEKGQAFGIVSRQHLADVACGKQAVADCYKIDR